LLRAVRNLERVALKQYGSPLPRCIEPFLNTPARHWKRITAMTATKKLRVYHLFFILMIAALTACSSEDSDSSDPDEKTGSLTFTINWDTEPEEEAGEKSAPRELETVHQSSVDCAGRGISSIVAALYDSNDEAIAQEEWPCDNHGGIIEGVPAPQSGVTIVLSAKDDNGNISYRGEKGDLTIEVGPNNNAGAIDAFRFIPSPPEPTGEPNTIQWNPVQGAAQYRLAFSETGGSGSPVDSQICSDTQFTVTTLAPETQYTVRVFAQDSRGNESGASPEGQLTTIELSAAPQNVTAEEKMHEITLNWEGEAGTLYNVYWSTTPGITKTNYEENGGKFEDIADPTFTHSSLEGNTVYYYVVTSENSVGQESELSAEISATAVGDPIVPEDVKAEAGDRKVTLSWTAAPGFVYNVYWSNEPGVSKTNHEAVVENVEGNTYVHEDCDSTKKYYYVITAKNEVTEGPPSAEVSASPGWLELFEHGSYYSNAVDTAGNLYIVHWTEQPIPTQDEDENTGKNMILVKHNPHGELEWERIFGTVENDNASGVGTDEEGNVYVVGSSGEDISVFKYNADGNHIWTKNFHLSLGGSDSLAIAVDPEGNSYITGTHSNDTDNVDVAFIAKYGPTAENNEPLWTHILRSKEEGGADSRARSIALDGQGGVYITGYTYGSFSGTNSKGYGDIFVAKYSAEEAEEGEEPLWVTQLGGEDFDGGTTIAANQNDCFVAGNLDTELYIAKLNVDDGAFQWDQRVDEAGRSVSSTKSIALTPNGNLIVGTYTRVAVFEDHTNRGEPDSGGVYPSEMLILAYDTEGVRLWYELPGTPEDDYIEALTIDDKGYAYFTGWTRGDLGGHINTGEDESTFTWKRFLGQ
jgi:hypothetical protein